MLKNQTVLVVGTGLIGGSLTLCLKAAHPELKIIAIDQNTTSLNEALASGAVDEISTSFPSSVLVSDIVILCTPVKQTICLLETLSQINLVKPLLVTDVGSTKQEIMKTAKQLTDPFVTFVGGHPMAGSHKSGFVAADVDLFENAYYVLTPSENQESWASEHLKELLKGTRAKFIQLSATEHDEITGMVSHLPHVIASGLVAQKEKFAAIQPTTHLLAAGGFRDITRIASSDPSMWTDILLSNQNVLLEQIATWQAQMNEVSEWLATENREAIYAYFLQAKVARDSLPSRKPGAIPSFNDLFIELPDYTGEIAKITGIIAQQDLSITNIKILENREDIFGTLQLTFKYRKDVALGKKLLTDEAYRCYEK